MSSASVTVLPQPWGGLRVRRWGRGPVVVALHGLGGSGRYWEPLARELDGACTLVAPDLPGFGGSDKPDLRYDGDLHVASLDGLVDEVADGLPVALAGHSVGAVLAALFAARRPERIRALALVAAPFPGVRPLPGPVRWIRDRPPGRRRDALTLGVKALWALLALPPLLTRRLPPLVVLDFPRQSLRARAWTAWTALGDPGLPDELAALARLPADAAALLLQAERGDRWGTAASAARWAELLPRAELETAPGGHHLVHHGGAPQLARWLRAAAG